MTLGLRRHTAGNRSSVEADRPDTTADDETVVDQDQGNVLSHIISQLRPGADLSRVTLPTFILEPRSMLERITNFMAHPEVLLTLPTIDDPIERFVAVTKFYLSGWHIKPPGVKKPLNPILGETFTGYWDYPDNTRGYYISEQTSHHPPKSSYFFVAPEHHIRVDGTLKPRSRFLGNSVGSFMEGIAVMRLLNRNERYFITQPNMYARGILFGKMKYELGDHAYVRCPELGLEAEIDFKVKGWMTGTYNAIGGHIKDTKSGKNLFEFSGYWDKEMYIKNLTTGKKELIFDATHAKPSYPKARPLEEQGDRESQRLWNKVTKAIKVADQRTATDEKSAIEDRQRAEAAERGESEWQPKLFRRTRAGASQSPGDLDGEENLDWVMDATIDGKTPDEIVKQVLAIAPILPGQKAQAKSQPQPQAQPRQEAPSAAPAPAAAPQPQQFQQAQPVQQMQTPQQYQPAPSSGSSNLVDFGHAGGVAPSQPTQQKASPLNTMSDLKEPLQPVIHRQDSVEGFDEEFHDADS
ncbi:Oxysterol-binding protein [Aureobasidium sp. EXF-3400]|nr:Oxysterol-binding protein [Aureobasidium sp. EXF-12344]KAI4769613.1 Oxysterol-binding protein [Aureobasidium sp. EXF-3400]